MFYGADYNPEQWPESVWPADARRMVQAGVNLVSLGIFAWSRIQPAEGVFDFDWLDRVLDLLHEHEIAVDLATATASPPPWMSARYPDSVAVDANGARYWPGSRQHQAPTSPVYRRLAADLVSRLAERYVNHPAVVLWHVNNEYGCHLHLDYSDPAAAAFRVWLEQRYGSVAGLNEAWGTSFWSQRYGDFSEVFPPRKAPYSHNPSQLLDFARFSSDALLECYLMEKRLIREAGGQQPITTNFMGLHRPTDYWRWAAEMDVISDDAYPDPADPESFRRSALQRDLMRSLKPDTPWMLMEQATSAVNWRPGNASKAPGQMAALSAQAVGRGADAVMFFQWRQSRAGSEKFHSAMLPQAGTETRTWREVVDLGRRLQELPALPVGARDAEVAIIVDWENWWAIENPDHPVIIDYAEQIRIWYEAFHAQHIQVDFAPPTGDLTGYRLVVAPQLYLLTDEAAANLSAYVEGGGRLLVGAFSDVVDHRDHFRDGGFLTQLGDLLGVRLEDFGALGRAPGGPEQTAPFDLDGDVLTGHLLAEEIHLVGAAAVARFSGGPAIGRPALTQSAYGQGTGYYLATVPDAASAGRITAWLTETAGVRPVLPGLPPRVEVARRGEVLTVINHDRAPVTLGISGRDLITGATVTNPTLEPYAVLLLREAREG